MRDRRNACKNLEIFPIFKFQSLIKRRLPSIPFNMKLYTLGSTKVVGILLAAIYSSVVAFAGIFYNVETAEFTQGPQPKVSQSSILVEDGNLKVSGSQDSKDQAGEMIFLGSKKELLMIDHKRRSYTAINEEQIQAISSKMEAAMAEYQNMLANVPPAQREMMKKMMAKRMPQGMGEGTTEAAFEVKETNEKMDINGYPTRKYEVYKNETLQQELWVTSWSSLEGSEEISKAFEGMGAMFDQFMKTMTQGPMGAMMTQRMQPNSWLSQMGETGGLPVMTRTYGAGGNVTQETKILSAENRKIDPSEFNVPKKYKRQ
ncbi:MAG: ribosomal protein L16/L10AE, partial [Candidatus Pelagisphaera sp.]